MKTEERNDDPMENLVNDLKNAEERSQNRSWGNQERYQEAQAWRQRR